jgi:hypothetical protein
MNNLVKALFKKKQNREVAQKIIDMYQMEYERTDKEFVNYILYELSDAMRKEEPSNVTSALERHLNEPSMLFHHSVFYQTQRQLEEELNFLENPVVVEDARV